MYEAISIYLFIVTIWFFQEWKETKDVTSSFIIGLFWVYEIFHKISNRKIQNCQNASNAS